MSSFVTPFNKCKDGWIEFNSVDTTKVSPLYSACVKGYIVITTSVEKNPDDVINYLQQYGSFHDNNIKYNLEYHRNFAQKMHTDVPATRNDISISNYRITLKVEPGKEIETVNNINKDDSYKAELLIERHSIRI